MKTILNHEIVKILDDGKNYRVLITMAKGGVLEHSPFPRELRGLIAAMDLAMNCMSGKFFPAFVHLPEKSREIAALIGDVK